MREIKFRAFDPHFGKGMYDPMPIIDFKVLQINGQVLMQYTGLKDKNGKEIYEGDVLVKDGLYPYYDCGKLNYVALVEWIFGGWQYVLRCVNPEKSGISDGINDWIDAGGEGGKTFLIIGNIYQNPELLKQ